MFERESNFTSRFHFDSNYQGCTTLHYATLGDQFEVVQFLLENGIERFSSEISDSIGLLTLGADPTVENRIGHVAADYCRDEATKEQFKIHSEQV